MERIGFGRDRSLTEENSASLEGKCSLFGWAASVYL